MLKRSFFSLVTLCLCLAGFTVAAHGATKDACALLTSADAQAAVGEPVGAPKAENQPSPAGDGTSCTFRATTTPAYKAKSVRLDIHYSNTNITGSAAGIAENLKSAGFQNVHTVTGVGTTAIWGTTSMLGRNRGELTVIQGKSVLLTVILAGVQDEAEALAHAKDVATKAIGRL